MCYTINFFKLHLCHNRSHYGNSDPELWDLYFYTLSLKISLLMAEIISLFLTAGHDIWSTSKLCAGNDKILLLTGSREITP